MARTISNTFDVPSALNALSGMIFAEVADRCIKGIQANTERARRLLDESTALVTALNPFIGYARASEIAQEALRTNARVYDLVLAKGYMTREQLDAILKPEVLTRPHYSTVHKPRSEP